jgi:DNA polymerase III subunit beta
LEALLRLSHSLYDYDYFSFFMIETEMAVQSGVKLRCSREQLVTMLGVVGRAVSTRTAVQILGGILLRAGEGTLELAATDMELSLRTQLPAEVDEQGSIVLPGRVLLDAVRALPQVEELTLELQEGSGIVEIRCGSAVYRLNSFSPEDFPRLPDLSSGDSYRVPRESLVGTANRVARSASRDESRPVLTGILARFEPGKLVMAATDSYRLAVKETAFEHGLPEIEAIIPARALTELARIAEGETVELFLQDNHVGFTTETAVLTSRRIDGQFPNYRQLLPETFEHVIRLPRLEILEVVKRVAVMAQRNTPLRLAFAEGELTISAQTQDVGEARESLPTAFSGAPLEIGFNAEFLREGIEAVEGDELELKLISPLRPGLLSAPDDDFWYLIMPIRLAG